MDPLDLLSKNLDLYIEMKELAAEQETLISREDMDTFMDLTARRHHLQRQIKANDREYRQCTKALHARPTDPKLTRLRKDLIRMIRSIQEIDKKIEDGLTQKKDLSLSEIKQIRKGQMAVRGYGGRTVRAPRFINKQG
ncbi:MAG: flagellar export chaperone FlgN [Deltaproteobacteria bacterium]|nr:flagellar export chaperone FlgN [Deltaproteobacteria bacterium]